MAVSRSLDYSIERAVKHYSSLFVLPSHREIATMTLLSCIIGGFMTVFMLNISLSGLILSLQFGLLLFTLSSLSDIVVRQAFLKSDPIYDPRRCAALSMFSILSWFSFLPMGAVLTVLFASWEFWINLFLIGFAAVCILRLIVLSSTSFASYSRIVASALAQPLICLLPMFHLAYSVGYTFTLPAIAYLLFSILLSLLIASIFINSVNRVGHETFKTPTTTILKAFLVNWMKGLNGPLESLFEKFGKEKTIDFSLLAFRAENHVASALVVSSFHPGPFKNVGSSLLQSTIQTVLEKKLGCVVAVPHGLFGHEYDLSSQQQNHKVLEKILVAADFAASGNYTPTATSFVRAQKDIATASCQIFGDCAVTALTLAPETTEDFPQEVGDFILNEASKLGLAHVVIINAHNSINNPFDVNSAVGSLEEAALDALKKAAKLKPSPFMVGAAKVVPSEFSLEDGMGPGGITVLTIKVGKQTGAYVTIDGNNIVSGLREKILDALKDLGVERGEVLTTDTHGVNAIVKTARGYHPVGDAIPHDKLIDYVKAAVGQALSNMKVGSSVWHIGEATNVNVIGEKQIAELSLLADKALRRAKRTAVPLFAATGLLLIAFLVLL